MKFESHVSNVTQVGDIKNNSVGIDANNLDFILTILSSNLYSKPIYSFIREIVSNAWDSHIEAGVKDAVILELGKTSEGEYFCSVEDFGVGLSPERFNQIYKNIGSSTKRQTNDQIGGFGIGRFSALAYSDVVHLTSYHDNICYKYLMYKDGDKISIDLLHQKPEQRRNGFKVQIPIDQYDVTAFRNAIREQLAYFENIYIQDSTEYMPGTFVEDFNDYKIKRYQNFSVNTLVIPREMNLILGKVVYPIRFSNLKESYSSAVRNYPISLRFNIGDLQITPNREEISYNTSTIQKIEEKIADAILEIQDLCEKRQTDFDDLEEYLKVVKGRDYVFLEHNGQKVSIKDTLIKSKLTYRGKSYPADTVEEYYNKISCARVFQFSHLTNSGSLTTKNNLLHCLSEICDQFDWYFFADIPSLTKVQKDYIKDTIDTNSFFIPFTEKMYKKAFFKLREAAQKRGYGYSFTRDKFDYQVFRIIFDHFINIIKTLPKFKPDAIPDSWYEKRKAKLKAKRLARKKKDYSKEDLTYYSLRFSYGNNVVTDSCTKKLGDLAKYKGIIVYAEKNTEKIRSLFCCISHRHVKFIEVARTKMKRLKPLSNCIKIEDFMNTKYKIIRRVATAALIEKDYPQIKTLKNIGNLEKISTPLKTLVKELGDYLDKYNTGYMSDEIQDELYELALEENFFDEEIKSKLTSNKKLLEGGKILTMFSENPRYGYGNQIPESKINLVVDYILARKLFIPNFEAVNKLKEETIFNIKKEIKDED